MNEQKPQLLITVFTDYICPFCFIGDLRLEKLRDVYDLKINWRFVEIHPDNPSQGRPVEELGYSLDQWQEMMGELGKMAQQEGIMLSPHSYTTNSHHALLLAEAAKAAGKEIFYRLNRRIFAAYFVEGQNIGDLAILRALARSCQLPDELIERAWQDPDYELCLKQNLALAIKAEVTGVPTFFIGKRKLVGAIPEASLRAAAANSVNSG